MKNLLIFQVLKWIPTNQNFTLFYYQLDSQKFIENIYAFRWTKNSWKYLGITFPLDLETLKKIKCDELIGTVTKQIKLKLSWPDKFQLIKSFILTKFIFLFQALPILILPKEIKNGKSFALVLFGVLKPHILTLKHLYPYGMQEV